MLRGVVDRQPGADRVDDLDAGIGAGPDKLREPPEGLVRIRLAPATAHERIVLGAVDERVHAAGTDEADALEALLMGPRVAVEAFDDATDRERRSHRGGS